MTHQESTKPTARILVVDDEPNARTALVELLREEGHEVHSAADGNKALGRIGAWVPDVVITDVDMPGLGGIDLLARVRELLPDVAVIVMTAFSSVEGAVKAMKLGADDYLSKPLDVQQLMMVVERTLVQRALRREAAGVREALAGPDKEARPGLIGDSKAFRVLLELARQVAGSPVSVLITGETGTGKETLARQIHAWSGRQGPWVSVKCGALGETTWEAELFGAATHAGRLQQARGGTLLLANVDELPLAAQARLVDVLQVRKPDDGAPPLDVRILATTSCDLAAEARAGRFREDLYYRLGVVSLRVPALRERQDDLLPLAQHFLKQSARQAKKTITGVGERALGVLMGFDWPGNLRQLENCIGHAVLMARGVEIEPRDLPREMMTRAHNDEAMPSIPGTSLYELERFAILRTLEQVGGSTSKAAKILGISPRKIQYRLQEYRAASPSPAAPPPAQGPGRNKT